MDSLLIQHHVLAMDSDAVLLVPPQHAHDCSSASSHFIADCDWQHQVGISAQFEQQQHQHQQQQLPPTMPARQAVGTAGTPAASGHDDDIAGMAAGPIFGLDFDPPKLCYTITTWAPLPVLQHLQQQSRAICASAAAGASLAAATIPGRPAIQPQHSIQDDDSCASSYGANWQVKHLQPEGACPLRTFSALPAQLLAPLDPDLEAGAKAALHHSSASLFVDIRTDDLQQQLKQGILARQQRLLQEQQLHQQQYMLQQQQQQGKTDASLVPVKRRCFDTSTAACNNLAINCEGRYSSSCSADASCQHDPHAAASPDSYSTMYTPTYSSSTSYGPAASPCFNNSGEHDLSPIIRMARGTAATTAAVLSTTGVGPRLQAVTPGAVLEPPWSSAGHAALDTLSTGYNSTADPFLQVKSGSRDDWLGPDGAEPYWQQQRQRPAAFTFGVHALLTPTGRETAAPEALADAAYAVAAMSGVHTDERARVANRLAVAAVHTAKTELAMMAAVSGQNKGRVPADACGHVGWSFRSFTTVGRAPPVAIKRPAVSQVPAAVLPGAAACMVGSATAPSTSAPCMEQQQLQQNPDPLQDQAANWATSNAFAAPAANTNNNWVVGAFGIAGPDCSYWQQHQQEMAGSKGWDPALASTVPAQPMLQQGMPCKQPPQEYCAQAADPCDVYTAYYDYYQQIEVPECPPSPHLNGADYVSDQCTMVCYSNTWKRTAEEAFGVGA